MNCTNLIYISSEFLAAYDLYKPYNYIFPANFSPPYPGNIWLVSWIFNNAAYDLYKPYNYTFPVYGDRDIRKEAKSTVHNHMLFCVLEVIEMSREGTLYQGYFITIVTHGTSGGNLDVQNSPCMHCTDF